MGREKKYQQTWQPLLARAPCDLVELVLFTLHCGLVSRSTTPLLEAQLNSTWRHISTDLSPSLTSMDTQGWVSGCGLLTSERRSAGCLPNLTLTRLFQVLLKGSQGITLCLFGSYTIPPSHILGTYLGNIILTTLFPKPASLEAARPGSPCTTHTYRLAWLSLSAKKNKDSSWMSQKGKFQSYQCESCCFCPNFTCAREAWYL